MAEGPWKVAVINPVEGSRLRPFYLDTSDADGGWLLTVPVASPGAWLGPNVVWNISVPSHKRHHYASKTSDVAIRHRVRVTPRVGGVVRPDATTDTMVPDTDPELYHHPGHYQVRANVASPTRVGRGAEEYAELYILGDGREQRTEMMCVPRTGFPWPGSDWDLVLKDREVSWEIRWIDELEFPGCPADKETWMWSIQLGDGRKTGYAGT